MHRDPDLIFEFTSHVRFDPEVADGYMKHYLPIPADAVEAIRGAGHEHVEGSLNEYPFRRAVHQRGDGSWCLKFGMTWLKHNSIQIDDEVSIYMAPDYDPDRVDVPDELAAELVKDDDLAAAWEKYAPSKRKMLGYHVQQAKRAETRLRRVQKIIDELRDTLT
ncbi:MAG: YdeI/OmpD-associated family protein [Chloroflexota bacterium]